MTYSSKTIPSVSRSSQRRSSVSSITSIKTFISVDSELEPKDQGKDDTQYCIVEIDNDYANSNENNHNDESKNGSPNDNENENNDYLSDAFNLPEPMFSRHGSKPSIDIISDLVPTLGPQEHDKHESIQKPEFWIPGTNNSSTFTVVSQTGLEREVSSLQQQHACDELDTLSSVSLQQETSHSLSWDTVFRQTASPVQENFHDTLSDPKNTGSISYIPSSRNEMRKGNFVEPVEYDGFSKSHRLAQYSGDFDFSKEQISQYPSPRCVQDSSSLHFSTSLNSPNLSTPARGRPESHSTATQSYSHNVPGTYSKSGLSLNNSACKSNPKLAEKISTGLVKSTPAVSTTTFSSSAPATPLIPSGDRFALQPAPAHYSVHSSASEQPNIGRPKNRSKLVNFGLSLLGRGSRNNSVSSAEASFQLPRSPSLSSSSPHTLSSQLSHSLDSTASQNQPVSKEAAHHTQQPTLKGSSKKDPENHGNGNSKAHKHSLPSKSFHLFKPGKRALSLPKRQSENQNQKPLKSKDKQQRQLENRQQEQHQQQQANQFQNKSQNHSQHQYQYQQQSILQNRQATNSRKFQRGRPNEGHNFSRQETSDTSDVVVDLSPASAAILVESNSYSVPSSPYASTSYASSPYYSTPSQTVHVARSTKSAASTLVSPNSMNYPSPSSSSFSSSFSSSSSSYMPGHYRCSSNAPSIAAASFASPVTSGPAASAISPTSCSFQGTYLVRSLCSPGQFYETNPEPTINTNNSEVGSVAAASSNSLANPASITVARNTGSNTMAFNSDDVVVVGNGFNNGLGSLKMVAKRTADTKKSKWGSISVKELEEINKSGLKVGIRKFSI